uniref:Uncharacterized protein n=1 Tax=Avena sativa TaxID=4498 RepID=A0ACD5WTF8_AVESA
MERMQLQGPIITSLCWADAAMAGGASAAQVPFLALLQGAMGDGGGASVKRESYGAASAAFACRPGASDVDLLESCVTQAASAPPVVEAAAAAMTTTVGAERRRKRPRTRPRATPPPEKRKKPEEAECQRMTHIAVERNRRRLMNDHLASLRALIPSDYIPRSDQATVVGGAIDYVKQLEQQLVALQALAAAQRGSPSVVGTAATAASDGVFVSPQYTSFSEARGTGGGVDVEAMAAVGGHVRVRVAGRRWPGRLVRAVGAMEDLRLAVLHLAVTSVGHDSVVYCLNLKIEDGCEVATADEVATVVHQIFAYAAGSCC